MKEIRKEKQVPPKVVDDYETDRLNLVANLQEARDSGLEIVCLDELVFSKHTIRRRTPALRNQTITLTYDDYYVPYCAGIASVSEQRGLVNLELMDCAVNAKTFKKHLKSLSKKMGGKPFALFLD